MKLRILFLVVALLTALVLNGAETTCAGNPCLVAVPTVAAALTTNNARVGQLNLSNTTGGALTVTLKDGSTNCGGSPCNIWPTVSIAANTLYIANLQGVPAAGGFTWVASGSGIEGWVSWGNQ